MVEFVAAPATLPEGERVYAIGDVHGCIDQLEALHDAIRRDMADRPTERCTIVHLGDYIDRGPDSAATIDLLANDPDFGDAEIVNLIGNHEAMFLAALASGKPADVSLWQQNGGAEALMSWRVPRGARPSEWTVKIPFKHQRFIKDLELSWRRGGYFFVHGGVRPGTSLEIQREEDLLWIREPFLSYRKDHGVVVVHGHTPMKEPVVRPNRIGIDTGAFMGGMLTCAVLEADRLGFIQR